MNKQLNVKSRRRQHVDQGINTEQVDLPSRQI
jgi:hypothetical protein